MGGHNLADVIIRQNGDLTKAEVLAREVLRIRTLIYFEDHHSVGVSCNLLARALHSQKNYGDETMGLYKRSLAIDIKHDGPDASNTAKSNSSLGQFYQELARRDQPTVELIRMYLLLAKSHFEESLRIRSKMFGSSHTDTLNAELKLADALDMIIIVNKSEIEYWSTGH